MVIPERLVSAEDLLRLSGEAEFAGKRLEISDGRLVIMSPTGWKHGDLSIRLGAMISEYARSNRLGRVTAAETGFVLARNPEGRDTVRAPDVGFVAASRVPADLPDGYVPFAPDLAVEVISPGDDIEDVHRKVAEYLRYGTRLVWLIYPKSKTAAAYTPSTFQAIEVDEALEGGDVLPGFRLALIDLFVD